MKKTKPMTVVEMARLGGLARSPKKRKAGALNLALARWALKQIREQKRQALDNKRS